MVMIYSPDRQIEPCEKKIISLGKMKRKKYLYIYTCVSVLIAALFYSFSLCLSHCVDKSGINLRTDHRSKFEVK